MMRILNRIVRWIYRKHWTSERNLGDVWKIFDFGPGMGWKEVSDVLDSSGLDPKRNVIDLQVHELPSGVSYLQVRIWLNGTPTVKARVLEDLQRRKEKAQETFARIR